MCASASRPVGVKHELVTGFDYAHETAENKLRAADPAPPADLYHPDPHQPYLGAIRYTGAVNESTSDDVGLFLGDTMKFWQDKIQLSGGVRWDYYEAELEQRAAPVVPGGPAPRSLSIASTECSVIASRSPTSRSRSARSTSPTARRLIRRRKARSRLRRSLPPPRCSSPRKIARSKSARNGICCNERLALTAAIFRTDKTNARTPGLTPNDPPMVLDGEQRVQGFEIGVAGNITERWRVFGGYTYLDSEILATNALTTRSAHRHSRAASGQSTAADAGEFLQPLDGLRAALADRNRRGRELCRRAIQLGG